MKRVKMGLCLAGALGCAGLQALAEGERPPEPRPWGDAVRQLESLTDWIRKGEAERRGAEAQAYQKLRKEAFKGRDPKDPGDAARMLAEYNGVRVVPRHTVAGWDFAIFRRQWGNGYAFAGFHHYEGERTRPGDVLRMDHAIKAIKLAAQSITQGTPRVFVDGDPEEVMGSLPGGYRYDYRQNILVTPDGAFRVEPDTVLAFSRTEGVSKLKVRALRADGRTELPQYFELRPEGLQGVPLGIRPDYMLN